ncbi:MAG: RES family NAD+ phosphorylase [Arachidicoccus sp.]|nr:RES family NAD+ phosphorylase [Arachidicoccus sp.]
MTVYRLCKGKYKNDLSGKGAELAGGRWNKKGFPVIYTSESRALCTTEIAVHIPLGIIPNDYYLVTIYIPDDIAIEEIKPNTLPADWKDIPYGYSTQEIGDSFLQANNYLILKVPSVVVPGDFNYLINPNHPDFRYIKITKTEKFEFDKRLFQK